jgi:hypothetical protein
MIAARTITGRTLALLLAGWLAVLAALFPLADAARHDITRIYLHRQDVWLLGAGALLWLAALAALRWRPAAWRLPRWAPALAAGLFALGCAGYHAVLAGYHLSRDEQMVDFDALIYAHGRLAWPVPPQWRADLPALNTLFIPPWRGRWPGFRPICRAMRCCACGWAARRGRFRWRCRRWRCGALRAACSGRTARRRWWRWCCLRFRARCCWAA